MLFLSITKYSRTWQSQTFFIIFRTNLRKFRYEHSSIESEEVMKISREKIIVANKRHIATIYQREQFILIKITDIFSSILLYNSDFQSDSRLSSTFQRNCSARVGTCFIHSYTVSNRPALQHSSCRFQDTKCRFFVKENTLAFTSSKEREREREGDKE